MTDSRNQQPDLLESALDAMRREPLPPGPSPELVEATVRQLQPTSPSPDELRRQQRRQRMFRIARYSSLSAAALALAAFIGWFTFLNGTAKVAFADVIKKVQQAESVTLTNRQKLGSQPEFEFQISIQKHHFRMELPDAFAVVADLKQKKALQIDLAHKIAYKIPISQEMAKRFTNPIEQFRNLKPKDAERRGDERLDGKTAHVYLVKKIDLLGFKGEGEMKIWVDPKTKLPLKIRIGVNSRRGSKATDRPFDTVITYEDFQWNKKIDPKLFELKIPKGYKVIEGAPGPDPVK
jgi:outer membrane lipoprotein-sorting protein